MDERMNRTAPDFLLDLPLDIKAMQNNTSQQVVHHDTRTSRQG